MLCLDHPLHLDAAEQVLDKSDNSVVHLHVFGDLRLPERERERDRDRDRETERERETERQRERIKCYV